MSIKSGKSPMPTKVEFRRLERIVCDRGVGSRKEVTELIRKGKVYINGERIRGGGGMYPSNITVEVNGVSYPDVCHIISVFRQSFYLNLLLYFFI
jgi:hypothetical protein